MTMKRSSRAARIAAVVLPMACAILVALPARHGTFVRDDWIYVPLNPLVSGDASVATVFQSSFQPERDLGLYRPVTTLAYLWTWRACGENPSPFHAVSFALAAIAAGLAAGLLLAWRLPPLWAALGATLFAVHPARSEAVLWISGTSELLMTVFSLAALVLAQAGRAAWRWLLVAVAATAAAFSKEQGFVLVLLVPLLPGLARRDRILGAVSVGVALVVAFAWRRGVLGATGPTGFMQVLPSATGVELVSFALHHLGRYVRLLFWPVPLLNEYDDPSMPVCVMYVVFAIVTLGAAPVLWILRRRRAAYAVLMFVVPLLPVLNVVYRTGESFAERFLCLPAAGFAALAALGFAQVPPRSRLVAASIFAALVITCAARFVERARDWTSQRAVVDAQMRDAPHVGGSHHLKGADLLDEFALNQPEPAHVELAAPYLMRAVAISPERVDAVLSLAKLRLRAATRGPEGDAARIASLDDAEKLFRAAIHAKPDAAEARGGLGLTLILRGRKDEAESFLREELRRHPMEFRAALNLAQMLEESGRRDDARRVREHALAAALEVAAARPGTPAPLRIAAQHLHALGRSDEAVGLMARALALPADPDTRASTAIESSSLFAAVNRSDDARRVLERTRDELEALPSDSLGRVLGLARLDRTLGDVPRARARLEAALVKTRGLGERRLRFALSNLD